MGCLFLIACSTKSSEVERYLINGVEPTWSFRVPDSFVEDVVGTDALDACRELQVEDEVTACSLHIPVASHLVVRLDHNFLEFSAEQADIILRDPQLLEGYLREQGPLADGLQKWLLTCGTESCGELHFGGEVEG